MNLTWKNVLRQLAEWSRFGAVGIAATLTYVVCNITALSLNATAYEANVAGYVFSVAVSYFGHAKWTFRSDQEHRIQVPKFAAVSLMTFALTNLIIYVVVDVLNRNPVVATIVVALAIPGITWVLARFWVFRKTEN